MRSSHNMDLKPVVTTSTTTPFNKKNVFPIKNALFSLGATACFNRKLLWFPYYKCYFP